EYQSDLPVAKDVPEPERQSIPRTVRNEQIAGGVYLYESARVSLRRHIDVPVRIDGRNEHQRRSADKLFHHLIELRANLCPHLHRRTDHGLELTLIPDDVLLIHDLPSFWVELLGIRAADPGEAPCLSSFADRSSGRDDVN